MAVVQIKADTKIARDAIKEFDKVVNKSGAIIDNYARKLTLLQNVLDRYSRTMAKQATQLQTLANNNAMALQRLNQQAQNFMNRTGSPGTPPIVGQFLQINQQIAVAQQKLQALGLQFTSIAQKRKGIAINFAPGVNQAAAQAAVSSFASSGINVTGMNFARSAAASAQQQVNALNAALARLGVSSNLVSTQLNAAGTRIRSVSVAAGASATQINAVRTAMGQAGITANLLTQNVATANTGFLQILKNVLLVKAAVIGLGAAWLSNEIIQATTSYQAMSATLLAVSSTTDKTMSAIAAGNHALRESAAQYAYVSSVAEEYGLSLQSMAEPYAKLLSASRASNLSFRDTKVLFEAVSAATSVMHLSAQDAAGVFKAFEQILSKGKVQSEELRHQLGDRFPMAMAVAAKSIQKADESIEDATIRLNKMMKAGELTSKEFVQKFGPALMSFFSPQSIEAAKNSLMATINRLKTDMFKTFSSMGIYMESALKGVFESFRSALKAIRDLGPVIKALVTLFSGFISAVAMIGPTLIYTFTAAIPAIVAYIAMTIKLKIETLQLAAAQAALAGNVGNASKVMAFSSARMAAGLGAAGLAVGVLLAGIEKYRNDTVEAMQAMVAESEVFRLKLNELRDWSMTASLTQVREELANVNKELQEVVNKKKELQSKLQEKNTTEKDALLNPDKSQTRRERDIAYTEWLKERNELEAEYNRAVTKGIELVTAKSNLTAMEAAKAKNETEEATAAEKEEQRLIALENSRAAVDRVTDSLRETAQQYESISGKIENGINKSLDDSLEPLDAIRAKWARIREELSTYGETAEKEIRAAMAAESSYANAQIQEAEKEHEKLRIRNELSQKLKNYSEQLKDVKNRTDLLTQSYEAENAEIEKQTKLIKEREDKKRKEAENKRREQEAAIRRSQMTMRNVEQEIALLKLETIAIKGSDAALRQFNREKEAGEKTEKIYQDTLAATGDIYYAIGKAMEYAAVSKQKLLAIAEDENNKNQEQIDSIQRQTELIKQKTAATTIFGNDKEIRNLENKLRIEEEVKKVYEDVLRIRRGDDELAKKISEERRKALEHELATAEKLAKLRQAGSTLSSIGSAISSGGYGKKGAAIGSGLGAIGGIMSGDGMGTGAALADLAKATGGGNRGISSFGGQRSGNYADLGAQIGGIFGPVWAVVGFVIGSAIKMGADDGIAEIKAAGKDASVTILQNQGGMGDVVGSVGESFIKAWEGLETVLGQELTANVGMHLRNDYIRVFVNGFREEFKSTEEALNFALIQSLKASVSDGNSNYSEIMRQAILSSTAKTMEELQRDLNTAFTIEIFGLPEAQRQLRKTSQEFQILIKQAEKLNIPLKNVLDEWSRQISKNRNSILGIEQTYGEKLRAEAEAWNKEREDLIKKEKERLNEFFRELKLSDNMAKNLENTLNALDGGKRTFQDALASVGDGLQRTAIEVLDITDAIFQNADEIRRRISDMENFINSLPPAITEEEIQQAIDRGGSSGSSSDSDNGAAEREKRRWELRNEFETMSNRYGKLTQEMLDFSASIQERHQEMVDLGGLSEEFINNFIAKMKEVKWKDFVDSIDVELKKYQFGGLSGELALLNQEFADLREAAIKLAEATGKDSEQVLKNIALLEKKRREELLNNAAISLGDTVLEFRLRIEQTMRDLSAYLKEFQSGQGFMTPEQLEAQRQEVMGRVMNNLFLELGDAMLSFTERYYGETVNTEEMRIRMERVRFEMEKAYLFSQFTLLKSMNLLSEQAVADFEALFAEINSLPEPDFSRPRDETPSTDTGTDNSNNEAQQRLEELNRIREQIAEQAKRWNEMGMNPLKKSLLDLQETFDKLKTELIKAGGKVGELAELEKALNHAREETIKNAFNGLKSLYEKIRDEDLQKDPVKAFRTYQKEYFDQLSKFRSGELDPEKLVSSASSYFDALNSVQTGGVGAKRRKRELQDQLYGVLRSVGYDPEELMRNMSDPVALAREGNSLAVKQLYELQLINGTISRSEYDKLTSDRLILDNILMTNRIERDTLRSELVEMRSELSSKLSEGNKLVSTGNKQSEMYWTREIDELSKLKSTSTDRKSRYGGVYE